MPAGQKCVICGENYGLIKYRQCGLQSFFCQGCANSVHTNYVLAYYRAVDGKLMNSEFRRSAIYYGFQNVSTL